MRSLSVLPGLLLFVAIGVADAQGGRGRGGGGVEIQPGQQCPAGMTEVRPRRCQAPTTPAPSIVDYRPHSTLVTDAHPVPRAKYPAIDFHGHPGGLLGSAAGLATLQAAMDSLNIGVMIGAENMNLDRITRTLELVSASPLKDRVRVFTGIDLRNVGPGWADKAVADLDAAVAAGAVGIGEIGKGFGQSTRKADGTRLRLDDPDLDPVWAAAARLGLPVFIHTGDPPEFWNPVDNSNERWLELSLFPNRQVTPERSIPFDSLMAERNNLFRRNPQTTFVAAHMGWHANDLGKLGRILDEMPNVLVEVGAILYDLGRQPRAARDFFVKYQDRILFGKDSFQPDEYPYFWRTFETGDEYFDYYRGYHAFWKLYGMSLPDDVLKKLYYKNALRLVPGLPATGFPN